MESFQTHGWLLYTGLLFTKHHLYVFQQGGKKVSEDILQIPVDESQNYFFFLEPNVSFGGPFPSAINKNKPYLKTWFCDMSLQCSTYFLVRGGKRKKKKALFDFQILEARPHLCRVWMGKAVGLGTGAGTQTPSVSNVNSIDHFVSLAPLLIFRIQ